MHNTFIYAGVAILALVVLGLVLTRLYRRAPKDAALIRTGFGGEKVVLNGGVIVLPVLHDLMHVSLNTVKLKVERIKSDSLLTQDKIRVDVIGLFHIRVAPNVESISAAAQTLGNRINEENAVMDLVQGKLISALRSVAATMTMEDLHANRAQFQQAVSNALINDLATNGLELEGVAITHFDQTDIAHLNENNAFDAEGLTAIRRITESRKKVRNEIEAENRVAIEQRNFEANQQSLEIKRKDEFARLEQEQAVATQRAETEAKIAGETAKREQEAEQARIAAKRETDTAQIEADRKIKEADIARAQSVELARQAQSIAIAEKSRDESVARAEADRARADAVSAAQAVVTAEQTAVANREKEIAVIAATQDAEKDAVKITVAASAERKAAEDRAAAARVAAEGEASALRLKAEGEADAEKLRADAAEVTFKVQAAGERALNEAKNVQSEGVMAFEAKIETIRAMPAIIEQSVKPLQTIESIRVVDVGGLNGSVGIGSGDGSAASLANGGNLAEQAVNAALKYRVNAPVVEQLAREVFGDNANLSTVAGLTSLVEGTSTEKTPDAPATGETPPIVTEVSKFYGDDGNKRPRKRGGDQPAAAQG